MRKTLVMFLVLGAFVVRPCFAADVWEDLMPGVRHLHRTTVSPKWDIHVVIIDLTNPRVDLRVGIKNDHSKPDAGETVRSLCQRYNAVVGINCDYFATQVEPWFDHRHIPQGYCVTDGLIMLPYGESSPIVPTRTAIQIPADNTFVVIQYPVP